MKVIPLSCLRCRCLMMTDREDAVCIYCGNRLIDAWRFNLRPYRKRNLAVWSVMQYAEMAGVREGTVLTWIRKGWIVGFKDEFRGRDGRTTYGWVIPRTAQAAARVGRA